VTQPMLGQIRLQWWREVIAAAYEGAPPRKHEVAEPLTAAIHEFGLSRVHFDRILDAREADLDDAPPATMTALEGYAEATSSSLIQVALEVLGVGDAMEWDRRRLAGNAPTLTLPRKQGREFWKAAEQATLHTGIAYSLAGLLRAMPFHARTGRSYIPADVATEAGLDPLDYSALRPTPGLRRAVCRIAETAESHLVSARQARAEVPLAALPALLPAVVAERALIRLRRAGWNPFDPRLAAPDTLQSWRLAAAALRRRV
jgi:NADH dehydrogenase [ubiquinone] 1 alpha subcomplex assembly factor 6